MAVLGDEPRPVAPPDVISSGFAALVEGLRDDYREDVSAMEGRVTAALSGVETRVTAKVDALDSRVSDYFKGHGQEHESEATDRREAHGAFYQFIQDAQLAQARKDGALGLIRFLFELVSRYRGAIVSIILALTAFIGVASGAVQIEVGR